MDNATSNDVLARSLATLLVKYDVQFDSKSGQIRCLPHVINLVVQQILSKLSSSDVADPDVDDYYNEAKKHSVHYDPNNDPDVQELEDEYQDDENGVNSRTDSSDEEELSDDVSDSELHAVSQKKAPIAKLRHIVTKIVSSPQRRYAFRQQVQKFYHDLKLMVIRDVKTRWNCTHAMIQRALLLQNAINAWVLNVPELHPYALTKFDWKVLTATEELLQPFTDITQDMSQSQTPTLCYAIPFYHHMKKHLTASVGNTQLTSIGGFHDAIAAGLAKLESYYYRALSNEFNIIATACHPSFRIDWFRKIDVSVYDEACRIVKNKYDEYRQKQVQPQTAPATPTKTGTSKQSQLSLALGSPIKLPNPVDPRPTGDLEWHRWCSGEGGGNLERPLIWWKEHAAGFPVMALVAWDFLAIQGSAVSVERLFSSSRHLCTDVRSSMKAKTITQAMCAKMWIKQGLLKV
ncbi:hypothetical protein FRC04_004865 [Tulasnella sp. 424]|nr:hypothetical protein FRC04_004865 [Tulasnella sp. 424]KAG8963542.1 hypothetical protein FRC05_004607 [Tulasnella sp. 425]